MSDDESYANSDSDDDSSADSDNDPSDPDSDAESMQELEDRGVNDDSSGDEESDSNDKDPPGLKNGYQKTVAMMMMIAILSVKA